MAVELLQDAIVTLAALGAGVVVARRVLGVVGVRSKKVGGCDQCGSQRSSRKPTAAQNRVHPVTLVRPSRR